MSFLGIVDGSKVLLQLTLKLTGRKRGCMVAPHRREPMIVRSKSQTAQYTLCPFWRNISTFRANARIPAREIFGEIG